MENEANRKKGRKTLSVKITANDILKFIGFGLFLMGVLFYLSWSILYGTWTDVGLYSFTVVMAVFGILAIMLADEKKRQAKR